MQNYKVSNYEEEENNYDRRKKTNYMKLMNNMLRLEKTAVIRRIVVRETNVSFHHMQGSFEAP